MNRNSARPTAAIEVGRVAECWRYPVKSMAGERLASAPLDRRGLWGDRAWAVLDARNGEITGAKNFPDLMRCAARYTRALSGQDDPAPLEILLPDGSRPARTRHECAGARSTATTGPLTWHRDCDHARLRRSLPSD
jgi:MOSC domain-containing protein